MKKRNMEGVIVIILFGCISFINSGYAQKNKNKILVPIHIHHRKALNQFFYLNGNYQKTIC